LTPTETCDLSTVSGLDLGGGAGFERPVGLVLTVSGLDRGIGKGDLTTPEGHIDKFSDRDIGNPEFSILLKLFRLL
jgi:hypothetical protein